MLEANAMSMPWILDGHCDTAMLLYEQGGALAEHPAGHWDLARARQLPGWAQVFAFCPAASPLLSRLTARQIVEAGYASFVRQLEQNQIPLCRGGSALHQALDQQHAAALLSLEGAEGVDCDPGRLEELAERGFCMVSLTWNEENRLAGSCVSGGGLSGQGKAFFQKAQRLGLVVDVSHLSDAAFWQLVRLADAPLIASHSNSRTQCGHPRNLTDDMYRAICDLGGVAGLNLYAPFLAERQADFEDVWRHVDHFLQLAGDDRHLALGADLDGCDTLPVGFTGLESYPALADQLARRGLSENTIARIFHENLLGVLDHVSTGSDCYHFAAP